MTLTLARRRANDTSYQATDGQEQARAGAAPGPETLLTRLPAILALQAVDPGSRAAGAGQVTEAVAPYFDATAIVAEALGSGSYAGGRFYPQVNRDAISGLPLQNASEEAPGVSNGRNLVNGGIMSLEKVRRGRPSPQEAKRSINAGWDARRHGPIEQAEARGVMADGTFRLPKDTEQSPSNVLRADSITDQIGPLNGEMAEALAAIMLNNPSLPIGQIGPSNRAMVLTANVAQECLLPDLAVIARFVSTGVADWWLGAGGTAEIPSAALILNGGGPDFYAAAILNPSPAQWYYVKGRRKISAITSAANVIVSVQCICMLG